MWKNGACCSETPWWVSPWNQVTNSYHHPKKNPFSFQCIVPIGSWSLFAGNSSITSKPMYSKALSHWRILLYLWGAVQVLGGRLAVLLFLAYLINWSTAFPLLYWQQDRSKNSLWIDYSTKFHVRVHMPENATNKREAIRFHRGATKIKEGSSVSKRH